MNFKSWLLNEAAINDLPYLDNLNYQEFIDLLDKYGFKLKREKSGYQEFKHIDGSEIKIRPDGRIKRIGPKEMSDNPLKPGKFQPKYIAKPGQPLQRHPFILPGTAPKNMSHDSGEKINLITDVM